MKLLKQSLQRIKMCKSGFFTVIGLNLLILACWSIVKGLLRFITPDGMDGFWNVLFLILDVVIGYLLIIGSIGLLNTLVIQARKMSFSQSLDEFISFIKQDWKKGISSYAIWNFLIPFGILLAATVVCVVIVMVFAGNVMSNYLNYYYYYYYDIEDIILNILYYNLSSILFTVIPAAFIYLAVYLFTGACQYIGISQISGKCLTSVGSRKQISFSDALTLSALPMAAAFVSVVLLIIGLILSFIIDSMGFMIFFLVVWAVFAVVVTIGTYLFKYIAYTAVVLDCLQSARQPDIPQTPLP